ncbi:MAG: IS110 family transposase [Micromonosporaceae bacterium]
MSLLVTGALFYVGIDWAAASHAVCVLNDAGRRVAGFSIEHSAAGFTALVRRLGRLGTVDRIAVAIERPDGRLVDTLLDAGFAVVPVSPNAIKTWRESETGSGAKSDAGDAYVIADYLRCRAARLDPIQPYSAATVALRTVVRTREDLVAMRVAATNQLAALLEAHWPGAKAIFADVESPIALAFLTRYPTAAHANGLGAKRLEAFCREHAYSGKRSGEVLLARLRAAPAGTTDPTICAALAEAVLAMVATLKVLGETLKGLGKTVTATLGEHPDGKTFTSLPRSGQINAAQMLAEWGDVRQAYDGPESIAALAGVTPVTKESGKHRAVHFRWACNKRLRVAITTFADNSRHASPWAANIYTEARARGHDHPHAIRILARAWIRIIWRCWIDQTPYDSGRHGNARQLQPTWG